MPDEASTVKPAPVWPAVIGIVIFVGVAGFACAQSPFPDRTFALIAVVMASLAAILGAYLFMEKQRNTPNAHATPAAILMNIVVFLSCMLLAVLAAADHWFVGIMTGIYSLLGGGIIGVLTAIPFAPEAGASVPPTPPVSNSDALNVDIPLDAGQGATVIAQVDPSKQESLPPTTPDGKPKVEEKKKKVQEVATLQAKQKQISVLGRAAERLNSVIGGAIAFNWKDVYGEWKHISGYVGSSMMSDPGIKNPHQFAAYGGGVILAFGLLGVVSGLLLTRIFLLGYLEDGRNPE